VFTDLPVRQDLGMEMTKLGSAGPVVSRVGLGCMAFSGTYGPAEEPESIATIHSALDASINLLDTGDFYGMGHNELLIAEALKGRARDELLLSVKFGAQRGPDGSWLGYDARPAAVKTALAYSLRRLGTDHIDIYRPARLDPRVPIEETVGAIADMIQAGYVRFVGLSEVGTDTIRRAAAVHPICDVQIEYSLLSRGVEEAILPTCRELGIAITAYGVLSRGLIGGGYGPERRGSGDIRSRFPRFQGDNLRHNRELVDRLQSLAGAKGASVAQLAIAWVLGRGDDVLPLIGSRRRDQLHDALGALRLEMDADDLRQIEEAVSAEAVEGERYGAPQMRDLDSER
jgi:aryl-alcohol dehydrogenase-like predicted oxidoreductase